jgi:hypothetical protein
MIPHVFYTGGLWWYVNSESSSYAFSSVREIQICYEQYEPNPRWWRSLPRTFRPLR